MSKINNPYLYHPHPLCKAAAEELCKIIASKPEWEREFAKGKMLGVLIVENPELSTQNQKPKTRNFLAAYSGIVDIEPNDVFVPPVYDLNNPDDFYKEEERKISEINHKIKELEEDFPRIPKTTSPLLSGLKAERKRRSQALQLEIFKHFDFTNHRGETKNIIDIFAEAKRGLPPGGAGECAAPRLLQYAFIHGLKPVAMAEFWYGISPRQEARIHRQFYPSCIEKCSPILRYLFAKNEISNIAPKEIVPEIIYEDSSLIILNKPAEVLSVPAKDTSLFNVETWLHGTHPDVKGPMLVHRLDQSTSGVMIAAKNAAVFKELQKDFIEHKIRKKYEAWVEVNLPSECGLISLPICPNPDDRPRQVVDYQFGKTAVTRYKVIKREGNRTLLALFPLTGRTHQLRLHCASTFGLDHPIIGDRIYNFDDSSEAETDKSQRLMLHAAEITFIHPVTNEKLTFAPPSINTL